MRKFQRTCVASLVLGASVVLGGASCGDDLVKSSSNLDELTTLSRSSSDVVQALAGREAKALGSSGDEVAGSWISRFRSARGTYAGIDPNLRAVACDAVTGWAGALATPGTDDDAPAVLRVGTAVADLNKSTSARSLATALESALQKSANGEPIYLEVLLIQTGVCQVAG
jgi:hypothetical protein